MSAPTYDQAVAAAPSSGNAVQGLQNDVSQLAPLAQSYHSAPAPTPYATYKAPSGSQPNDGAVMNFFHFAGSVASQIGNVTGTAANWLKNQTVAMATSPIRYGAALAHGQLDNLDLAEVNGRRTQLDGVMQDLQTRYSTGQISKDEYSRLLSSLSQDYDNLDNQSRSLTNRFSNDYQEAKQATIDTSAALLTVLTAGFGKATSVGVTGTGLVSMEARTAGSYLASGAARAFFGSTEDALRVVAAHPQVFDALAPGMKAALEQSVAEVVATGAKMSTAQIARASAVNLALKYPINYWWVQGTASDLYHELDQAKYGDATRTAAFNAALLLSGGPIGYALKWAGKGAQGLVSRMFLRSSFIDELSKGIGTGEADGLWKEINTIQHPERFKFLDHGQMVTLPAEQVQKRLAANLSALEATNMEATGKDPVAAAWRVLKGMANYEGISMKDFTHEDALVNMSNFAEAQRAADEAGKVLNTRITVGRVDARSLNKIAADLTAGDRVAEGLPTEAGAAAPATDMTGAPDFLQPQNVLTEAGQTAGTRPSGEIQTQIEQLMNTPVDKRAPPFNFAVQAVQLAKELPPQDAASELRNLTIDGKNIGDTFYKTAVDPETHKISLVLKDPAIDPLKMTPEEVATHAGLTPNLPAGYQLTNAGVVGPDGNIVKDVQSLDQPSFLTDFEKAHNKGDFATMAQIIAQHPGDARLDLTGLLTPQDNRLLAWEKLKIANPDQAWAHNENFNRQVVALIKKYDSPEDLTLAISKIKAEVTVDGLPKELSSALAQMGYLPIQPGKLEAPFTEGAGKVASSFAKANSDIFTKTVQPVPILTWLGGVMSKAGLSPYATSERVYQLFNDNLSRNLQTSGVISEIRGESLSETTDTIIKKLSSYMHDPTAHNFTAVGPITDLRMLTTKDIATAAGVTRSEAKIIQDAIARSFIQVPLAVRGLGDRAVDLAYGLRGVAAVERRYLRLQGALRFSWNPFFQYLRLVPKTEMLAEFEGGGFISSVFAGRLKQIGEIRTALRENGFLEKVAQEGNVAGEAGATRAVYGAAESGEAADFAGSMGRNLTHKLVPAQEASIAGLVDAQAQRMGMEWKDYMAAYPDHVRDTIQMIAQYDKRSQILNSPLLRTLNVAVFPLRFDTKVAMIMGRSLARQPLMTQVAVVKGLMSFHDWINSDQGRAWYAQNADAIGLFNYITPIAHIAEIVQSLVPGQDHSLGNFGELGGLPFGFIPQLLDSEGLTHFNQAGADPKTGEPYSQYLPVSARGQIAVLIQDFLSSIFSYPGATVGLLSKTKITRGAAEYITGANNKDFLIKQPTPTPEQLSYQQALQRAGVTNATPAPVGYTPTTSQNAPTLPTSANVAPAPRTRAGSAKKKKKSEFTPALLPGQTTLGQL